MAGHDGTSCTGPRVPCHSERARGERGKRGQQGGDIAGRVIGSGVCGGGRPRHHTFGVEKCGVCFYEVASLTSIINQTSVKATVASLILGVANCGGQPNRPCIWRGAFSTQQRLCTLCLVGL